MVTGKQSGRHCSACGDPDHDRRSCPSRPVSRHARGRAFDPWLDLEWEQHAEAREIVAKHPDGMTLEQVGNVLGVTRERVRQIEAIALGKLRTGLDAAETVDSGEHTVAMTQCEECFEFFPRVGRRKFCDEHRHLEKAPRPRPVAPVVALHSDTDRHGHLRARAPVGPCGVSGSLALALSPSELEELAAFDDFADSLTVELPTLVVGPDLELGAFG